MFNFIPKSKADKNFFLGSCIALVFFFLISLIQNYIRYGEYSSYKIWQSITYLAISVLLFAPFIILIVELLRKVNQKYSSMYWGAGVLVTVVTLLVFYLFSNAFLQLFGYFDSFFDINYTRQYFGREALFHLLILAATVVYVNFQANTTSSKMITGTIGKKVININANSIKWIEADDHYLNFYTENQTIVKRATMNQISKDLEPDFVRIHRKYLVNKKEIVAKERHQRKEFVVLTTGQRLSVGRSYRDSLGTESWIEV